MLRLLGISCMIAIMAVSCVETVNYRTKDSTAQAESPATISCSGPGPWRTSVDNANVYWTNYDAGTVMKVSLVGGTATILASNQEGPCSIAVNGNYVYWTNNRSGEVMRVPTSGGDPILLVSGLSHPTAIAADLLNVYWFSDKGLEKAPASGGKPIRFSAQSKNKKSSGTIHCDLCPIYCERTVCDLNGCHTERYICQWYSCNCRPVTGGN